MQQSEYNAEQPSYKCSRLIIAPASVQAEVIPQHSPRCLGNICVAVGKKIIASGFAWESYRASLMDMQVGKTGRVDWACL